MLELRVDNSHVDVTMITMQTDPTRRTTVDSLLRDPWVMKDYETAVLWQSKIEVTIIIKQ